MGEQQSTTSARATASEYRGPKDVGRAESLYQSALTKPDIDYCMQLLFSSLVANPEHLGALETILSRLSEASAGRRKVAVRINDLLNGSPADDFMRSLAAYTAAPTAEPGIACAADAKKIGLLPQARGIGERVLLQWEEGKSPIKIGSALRLMEVLEGCGAFELAVRAARCAMRSFPNDQMLREREKNLLARQYLKQHDPSDFRENLLDRPRQESAQRAVDPMTRIDNLERHYGQTHEPEDFRELVRALREAPAARRETALASLQDGYERFGEKETLWFIREIRLERRWADVRLHEQVIRESPADDAAKNAHAQLQRDVLREHIDHLYEVASALPPGPDRNRRELELTRRLFAAERFEEAVKQAQRLKNRAEYRLESWVLMAKSFVQLGLTMEAGACFENILAALQTDLQEAPERVLDAKYSYASFLTDEAQKKGDVSLAAQARKLCADVTLEDIDYRGIRELSARAEALCRKR